MDLLELESNSKFAVVNIILRKMAFHWKINKFVSKAIIKTPHTQKVVRFELLYLRKVPEDAGRHWKTSDKRMYCNPLFADFTFKTPFWQILYVSFSNCAIYRLAWLRDAKNSLKAQVANIFIHYQICVKMKIYVIYVKSPKIPIECSPRS